MSWDAWEKAAEEGPRALGWKLAKVFLILFLIGLVLSPIMCAAGWLGEAQQVAREEFGPRELLRKYEWFKDAAAQLDKKKADISVYTVRLTQMKLDYEGTSRKDWDRTDKEQMSLWHQEVAGVKAGYNGLAAEYNSQMSKFNWRFTNAGDLPKGATMPLPREFKAYASE